MSQQNLCHSINLGSKSILSPEGLERKINSITEHQRKYIRNIFLKLAQVNPTNAPILYDYLMAQQNELNIKESTKESTIKRIIWLSAYLDHKTFSEITKDDILSYLTSKVNKPASGDSTHKWIGTYNGTQMVFSTFFRWLYNSEEPDTRKRITPPCMKGIKRLPRQEKSPFKPSDLWT
ncbi:MAG: hypothetical protein WBE34_13770, partial [Candidatus Nitrosopolaris sp.]